MTYLRHFWRFIVFVYNRFMETEVMTAAAAISYYGLFSLFPLIVFLIAFNSSFLRSEEVQETIINMSERYLPGSKSLVDGNIKHMIRGRRTVSLMGSVILLWSATLVFAEIVTNINKAWPHAPARHFLKERFMALLMIGVIVGFLVFSLVFTTVVNLLPEILERFGVSDIPYLSYAARFHMRIIPIVGLFVAFTFMYRLVPNTIVRWREAAAGAFFSATMLEATKFGFIYYLTSSMDSYQLIYGSLGALVAFMLWVHLSSCVILTGAHVSASVAHHYRHFYVLQQPNLSL